MKSNWIGALALAMMALACEVHKDPLITTSAKINFIKQQPLVTSLTRAVGNTYVSKFEVVTPPGGGGKAEIILDKFMIYTPGTQSSESTTLRMLNKEGKLVGTANISFEESYSSCGIVSLTKAVIAGDSVLHVTLANDSIICEQMNYTLIGLYGTAPFNDSGFSISASSIGGHRYVDLTYTPSSGFTGTSKVLYIVGINVKPEYQLQYSKIEQGWSAGGMSVFDELDSVSFMYEYFLVSIAEVNVE